MKTDFFVNQCAEWPFTMRVCQTVLWLCLVEGSNWDQFCKLEF